MKQVKLKLVKSAFFALTSCTCVFSAFAGDTDTWYLNKSLTTASGHLNAKNWTSQTTGQPGADGGSLNVGDDYIIARTTQVNAALDFPGGSLSIADLLAYLYFYEMKIDPKQPKMAGRDRLVLSKGHAAPKSDRPEMIFRK